MLRTAHAFFIVLSLLITPFARAEGTPGGSNRHLSKIVFSGLAGSILGLSTLSFYGRPQDRLDNIAVGFAFGIIIGTISTTYSAVSEPREFYGRRERGSDLFAVDRPAADRLATDPPRLARADGVRVLNFEFTF